MPSISHNSHIPYAILNIKARVSNLSMGSIHTIRMRTIDTIRCWLIIFVPVGKNLLDLGGVGETIDILKVLLGDLERTSCDIGSVFANQLAWIDGCLVDLLEEERSERLDTRSQEGGVEGHVDAFEGNDGKASFQLDWFRFGIGLFSAATDDFLEMRFDVLKGQSLHELLNVNLLSLEEVGNTSEGIEGTKITSTHVLHVADVVIDNF